jgi:hypothetical protein
VSHHEGVLNQQFAALMQRCSQYGPISDLSDGEVGRIAREFELSA